eukprot:TRINITY_DN102163_c0_g1_i1.p1 TRINITY_DN102163_c0_g1~~TRINITY_DN102163_c0_g1_i1.p1  ORF type:complete len:470 (-),score=51.96 TRINITY_DN102163_c0_g1_i1:561-1970(-)
MVQLKDFSLELKLSQTGVALAVERFQVDRSANAQAKFCEPYLLDVLRLEQHGWIDTWPDYMLARLLTVEVGPNMDEEYARHRLGAEDVKAKLIQLANRELPTLTFSGVLQTGKECDRSIWKLKSKGAPWIAEMREEMRKFFKRLGFTVLGLQEAQNELHIVVRGKYGVTNEVPKHRPSSRNDLQLVFDKIGLRARNHFGQGTSQPFGYIQNVNFGVGSYVTSGTGRHAAGHLGSLQVPSADDFPRRGVDGRRAQQPRPAVAEAGRRHTIVYLHPDAQYPLNSEEGVGVAASLVVADNATASTNAEAAWMVRRNLPESFVLLKVSRDPDEYYELMRVCDELKRFREALGSRFQHECGAYFVVASEKYEAALGAYVLWANRSRENRMLRQHIIVSQGNEKIVKEIVRNVPTPHQYRVRVQAGQTRVLPDQLSRLSQLSQTPIIERVGFIEPDVRSSLLPSSTSGPHARSYP